MNHCAIQNGVIRSQEEMRSSFAAASTMFMPDHRLHRRGGAVVCPKPRRVGLLSGAANAPSRPSSWHLCHPSENSDSKAGSELLDIILAKGGPGFERFGTNTMTTTTTTDSNNSNTQVASSPPFFCGSPPSRVSNPLIQDARFREEKLLPYLQTSSPAPSSGGAGSPLSPTPRKVGCVRANFGNKPSVRIEGFDCLDRDRSRNCSIPALA